MLRIIKGDFKKVEKVIKQFQLEINSLNISSRYLNSKLYMLIAVVQNLDFFDLTYSFYNFYGMIGITHGDLEMFTGEYATAIDNLIKIQKNFKKEISPYWDLLKYKSTIDILDKK